MISFGLTLAFLLEVVLCIAACVWFWDFTLGNLPIGLIVVIVVAVTILTRLLLVAVEFLFSLIWRSQREQEMRIGFLGGLYMFLSELFCFLLVFALLIPFSRKLVAQRRGSITTSKQLPVLLIHGFGTNAGIWTPLITYLWNRGLSKIFTLNLMPQYGDLDDYAQQVAARVNRICDTTGSDKVILIGHALGGLVARAYVEQCGGHERVSKLVEIASPNHGTALARFVPGVNTAQIRIGSEWLNDLNKEENWHTGVEYVSIFSAHDNVVLPQASAQLAKARNVKVKGKGHFALLFSKEVGQLVYREIVA